MFTDAQINSWLATIWLPFLRVTGALVTAPLFGASYIPVRIRILVGVLVAAVLVPVLPAAPAYSALDIQAVIYAANEILLGVALGFLIQLVFEAVVFAGQTISMGMGLGFAMLVDPQNGVSVPVLSQFFLILVMLLFMSMNGHLEFLKLLANSFTLWPTGKPIDGDVLGRVIEWSAQMFAGALRIALPAVISLLVVQVGVGVISRAAPTLNLFAVGFPIAILVGYLVIQEIVPPMVPALESLFVPAFQTGNAILSGGSNG